MKKYNYEFVKNYFEENGCKLESETYINSKIKLDYICVCGRPHSIPFERFIRGVRCIPCGILKGSQNHKHKIQDVAKIFQDGGCKLISTYFQDARTPLDYICECGDTSKITLDSFKKGTRCMACGQKKSHDAQRLSYDSVYEFFMENNCLLISSEYKGFHEILDYICECGEPSKIAFSDFKSGKRCWGCGRRKIGDSHRLDYDFVKLFFENNNCTLLSLTYNTTTEHLDYICECGQPSKIVFDKFRVGQRCNECGNIKIGNAKRGIPMPKVAGDKNPNFNPFMTDEEREIKRNYPSYRQWVKDVFIKDNFTCKCCGKRGNGNLVSHHLDGYNWCIEKRTDINNGITLCEDCHLDFHHSYGWRDNTREQFEEYYREFMKEYFEITI